jgi:hypothetical protein
MGTKEKLSREAAAATHDRVCCRRFATLEFLKAAVLRADAHRYLPPLRGSGKDTIPKLTLEVMNHSDKGCRVSFRGVSDDILVFA